ncbi:sigma-54-dependent Fis family transcriptional regulator, partial [Acidobacteria bacterium ACD]|nr:sigma-54-dependent Fis family transcriptional regulator [Acidobacteria bacterium ACD]
MPRTPRPSSPAEPAAPGLGPTRHPGLKRELLRLRRAADSDATVLLLGGPGTGKDRLARELHEASRRNAEPFVRIDLAAVADDLFESELFGHEKGAFTGAVASKPGLLEGAGAGTIYLDRIDTVSARAQGKLLRVLEERVFTRVGGTRPSALRARFVASASPELPRRVRAGEFREDLYYRLAVVTVRLPSLAERRADLLPAARAILRSAGGPAALAAPAAEALLAWPWRGGFRELQNVLLRAALEARQRGARAVEAVDLGLDSAGDPEALLRTAARSGWTLRQLSDAYVDLVLSETGGNVSEAARRLGVARKTLY